MLIADGAAWGIGNRVVGNAFYYSILRLDLQTSQVTDWFEGPANYQFWPQGVDDGHRLYIALQDYSTAPKNELVRLDQPGQAVQLV